MGWAIALGLVALVAGYLGYAAPAGVLGFALKLAFLLALALLAMSAVNRLMARTPARENKAEPAETGAREGQS